MEHLFHTPNLCPVDIVLGMELTYTLVTPLPLFETGIVLLVEHFLLNSNEEWASGLQEFGSI